MTLHVTGGFCDCAELNATTLPHPQWSLLFHSDLPLRSEVLSFVPSCPLCVWLSAKCGREWHHPPAGHEIPGSVRLNQQLLSLRLWAPARRPRWVGGVKGRVSWVVACTLVPISGLEHR